MGTYFYRFFVIFLLVFVGPSVLGIGEVHATGGFDVPEVNDQFNNYEKSPATTKDQPINSQPVKEEKGILDRITQPISDAWDWTVDKISGAWEWTKETASNIWDWFVEVLSKMTEVVVDALSAAWDWLKENIVTIGLAVGLIVLIAIAAELIAVGGVIVIGALEVSSAVVGGAILVGIAISGLFSWLSGSDLNETLSDMLIGGISGGIGGFFGSLTTASVAGSGLVSWLGSRIPWLGRAFPTLFGEAVGGGTGQSFFDWLKTGKVNLKNTAIAAAFGAIFSLGAWSISNHSGSIISKINDLPIPTFEVGVLNASGYEIPTISFGKITVGDTEFGAWLQKFASNDNGSVNLNSVPSVRNGEFNRWFNSLTPDEFDQVWSNPSLRKTIESRLRQPGGYHEWLLVSRAPTFKRWGITAEQIKEYRTPTRDVKFVNPNGSHGRKGSTTAHNELIGIIDSSPDFETFKRRLQNWANYRLEGGAEALPEGLRP